MKVVVLYRPNSEHARVVEQYIHDFTRQEPDRKIELLSIDTVEGSQKAEVYDITAYPAVLALADDGQLLKYWQGDQLPLMNELAYYAKN